MSKISLLVARAAGLVVTLLLVGCAGDGPGAMSETAAAVTAVAPSDPLYSLQWNLAAIHVPDAWAVTTGSAQTVIAVLDSGTWPHADLDVKFGPGGYDFMYGDADPKNDNTTFHHGMHVAGILGAATNNGVGVAGICWNCPIMAERIAGFNAVFSPGNPIAHPVTVRATAIRYAAGFQVDDGAGHFPRAPVRAAVANISLGNYPAPCDPEVQDALDAAWSANTPVVAAIGNAEAPGMAHDCSHRVNGECNAALFYWATCHHVITVTSATAAGVREAYAPGGAGVTIAAPGGAADGSGFEGTGDLIGCPGAVNTGAIHGVPSTWVTDAGVACYRYWAGNSMATPHVAGVIALMKSVNPGLTSDQVLAIVQGTATHQDTCMGCGAGVIDALAAVNAAPFSASASCAQTTPGSFSCTSTITGGVHPTGAWTAGTGATITSQGSLSAAGTCASGPASVTFTASEGAGRQVVQTVGFTCARGHLTITTPIQFGSVAVGGSASRSVVATNTGNAAVTISSASLATQTGPAALSVTGPALPVVVPPGGSLTQTITCRPPIEASIVATLTVASNADNASVSSNLTCQGVAPHIGFTPTGTLALGDAGIGGSSSATLSVRNTSASVGTQLTFRASGLTGDFSLSCDSGCTCADGACTGTVGTVAAVLRIAFTPQATGPQQSTVRFTANDPQRPQTTVSVTGQGILLVPEPGPPSVPDPVPPQPVSE